MPETLLKATVLCCILGQGMEDRLDPLLRNMPLCGLHAHAWSLAYSLRGEGPYTP